MRKLSVTSVHFSFCIFQYQHSPISAYHDKHRPLYAAFYYINKDSPILTWRRLLYGDITFLEGEEYRAFQFNFLAILMLAGALVTGLLLIGIAAGTNTIDPLHVVSMRFFVALSLLLWLALRGRPQWFLILAWMYELICIGEYISSLYLVSADEMRVIWFFTNIPGVYILLGQRAGMFITLATIIGLALGNRYLPQPYSSNALATLLVA